jgi:phosphatidylserine/phosphatidylglycerophosphate/cardiolipin synthase-like enzyme
MSISVGSIRIYMGPNDVGGPDDLEATIVGYIAAARDELLVAVQELESESIARALTAATARGVNVKVILERRYLGTTTPPSDPFNPGGTNDENRRLFGAILRAGIDVTIDLNPETFHQKFIVRDPDGPSSRAAVLTGSTNFTPTGLHSNLNHLVYVGGKRTAGVYRDEFDEMWGGTFGAMRQRRDPKPAEYRVSGVRVKVLFAPDHAPEMEIMKQLLKVNSRVDFAVFTFTDSSGIDDAMRAIASPQVQVRGVIDQLQGNQTWAATHGLVGRPNIEVHLSNNTGGLNKLHHKLLVLDDQVVIAGSFNFTLPATNLNDENIIVIGDLDETNPVVIQKQRDLAVFARREIDWIIANHAGPAL